MSGNVLVLVQVLLEMQQLTAIVAGRKNSDCTPERVVRKKISPTGEGTSNYCCSAVVLYRSTYQMIQLIVLLLSASRAGPAP